MPGQRKSYNPNSERPVASTSAQASDANTSLTRSSLPREQLTMDSTNSQNDRNEASINSMPNDTTTTNIPTGDTEDHRTLQQTLTEETINQIVISAMTSSQNAIVSSLETRLSEMISNRIEESLNSRLASMHLAGNVSYQVPRDVPSNYQDVSPDRRRPGSNLGSESSSINNASRMAQLIHNWDIKFDGSPRLAVEKFIKRVELQVIDSLGCNFEALCEHAHCLFINDAKDWYWRYRETVQRVTWDSLRKALKTHFGESHPDSEIKERMRNRMQGPTESFDEYRNAVLKISESLTVGISEPELLEILQRCLRVRTREKLLVVQIKSLFELRQFCLKFESFYKDMNKASSNNIVKTIPQKRHIMEVNAEIAVEIDVLNSFPTTLVCWNCKKPGHPYHECMEERTLFCYGCGAPNTYKPQCSKCQGNGKMSEGSKRNPREDPLRR